MIEALTLMKTHGSELYILSDANTVYIETVLKVKNLRMWCGQQGATKEYVSFHPKSTIANMTLCMDHPISFIPNF